MVDRAAQILAKNCFASTLSCFTASVPMTGPAIPGIHKHPRLDRFVLSYGYRVDPSRDFG